MAPKNIHEAYWDTAPAVQRNFMRTRQGPQTNPMRRAILEATIAVSKSVLEVGCATCIDYELFKETNINYVGLDLTHRLLLLAKDYTPSVTLMHGDGRKLPFQSGSFDSSYCKDVLEHLLPNDYKMVIKELWRVAKKQILVCLFGDTRERNEIEYKIHCTTNNNIQDGPVYFNHYAENKLMDFFNELSQVKQIIPIHDIPYEGHKPPIKHGRTMYIIKKGD